VEPVPDEGLSGGALGLSNLVLVVRKNQVFPAEVDVQRLAQLAHAHDRAFQVPARASPAPGRIPRRPRGLVLLLGGLPEGEVPHVVLLVVVGVHPRPRAELVGVYPGEATVVRERRDVEVDGTVVGLVGQPLLLQAPDEFDHLPDVAGGAGVGIGIHHAEGPGVLEDRLTEGLRVFGNLHARVQRRVDGLVVHVGQVHDEPDVEALPLQVPMHQVVDDEAPVVADVGVVVDGRSARVHPRPPLLQGLEGVQGSREGVVEFQRHAGRMRIS